MTHPAWRADPLTWGHGPRVFEAFLEPTCPFSVRAFNKLDDLLAQAGDDRIIIKIRLHSQPWHMYSGVIVRCILAASTLAGGRKPPRRSWPRLPHIVKNSSSNAIAAAPTWPPHPTTSLRGSNPIAG